MSHSHSPRSVLEARARSSIVQSPTTSDDTSTESGKTPLVDLSGYATPISLTLPDSLTHAEWQAIGVRLHSAERSLMWWIGDWLCYGERRWGEMYRDALAATGQAYTTLQAAKWVAQRFELLRRRNNLTWSHHREVAALAPATADALLDRAQQERMSIRELRTAVQRIHKCRRASTHDAPVVPSLSELIAAGTRFGCIYVDPPWPTHATVERRNDAMSIDALCALPVAELTTEHAHLHLWATFIPDALRVMAAWGFRYCADFLWIKQSMGPGDYWRVSHESMLLGVKGDLPFAVHDLRSWQIFERAEHSARPEEVRAMIMRASPGPYLELFARRAVAGWTVWGDEIAN